MDQQGARVRFRSRVADMERVRFVCSSPDPEVALSTFGESTFRVFFGPEGTVDVRPKTHSAGLLSDLLPCLDNDVRIEVQFVLVVLSATSTLVLFVPDEKPEHMEIGEVVLHAF